jgi:plastocyanin
MTLTRAIWVFFAIACLSVAGRARPQDGGINGKVTFAGTVAKPKPIDVSKEPACVKMHANDPLVNETVVTGPDNTLANVVVYISGGPSESNLPVGEAVNFDQKNCHYATHVLAVQLGQEIKISNSDPFSHNIHPQAKVNREWNRMQLPNTPSFSYAYDKEEFIPVKCNIHPWMQGYFVILKTSHFAVTGEDGHFSLPHLPPGHYVVTAWHESFGTKSQDINVTGNEEHSLSFVFDAKH